jgi:plasmid maintenance system antidote protein VapI
LLGGYLASLSTELVSKEYQKRKNQNPRYSLRAFARDIGLNSGTLSSILKGRRKLPAHLFNDLSQKIESLSEHKDLFKNEFQRAQRSQNKSINFERLVDAQLWNLKFHS